MNTYFKYNNPANHSIEYFAVRNGKNYTTSIATRIPATAKLRDQVAIKAIPTYQVLENGQLGSI